MATVTTTSPYGDLKECLSLTNSGTTDLAYNFGNILKISDEYTFSCWIKANKNTKIKVQISNNISDYFTVTTAWTKVVYTAKADISKSKVVLFSVPAGVTLYAFEGMLEKGNMPSDFKKNEEDLENTVTTLQTDFKVEQGKITSLIKETETIKSTYTTKDEFNNLQIGGRNLALQSKDFTLDSKYWYKNGSWASSIDNEGFTVMSASVSDSTTLHWDRLIPHKYIYAEEMSKGISVSFDFMCDDYSKLDSKKICSLQCYDKNKNRIGWEESHSLDGKTIKYDKELIDGKWIRAWTYYSESELKTHNSSAMLTNDDVYYASVSFNLVKNGSIHVKKIKIELGNRATDWTPAPEDLETKVTTLTDKYNQTVQTVEGNKTTIASIKTTVDDHTKNIKSMDSRITTVETTADGLKTSVSKVQSDVDNLQVGGRNLLTDTNKGKKNWAFSSANGTTSVEDYETIGVKLSCTKASSSWQYVFYSIPESQIKLLKPNTEYTLSFDAICDKSISCNFSIMTGGAANALTNSIYIGIKACTTWTKMSYKFTTNSLTNPKNGQGLYLGSGVNTILTLCIKNLKLELGNKPTDWTPAPEDVDSSIQTLAEQTASKFSWIVKSGSSSTDFTLTDRTAQLVADNINLKGLVKFSGLNSDAQTKINNAQSTADSANSKIDNLSIGGRNLIKNGKGDVKDGFFKNFNTVADGYGEVTFKSKANYTNISLSDGFLLKCRDYEVGKKVTMSYDIMYTAWNFPDGTNRNEFWIGQRYGGVPSGQTGTGAWSGVTKHNLPVVGSGGCELNKWFHVKATMTIPTQASSNIGEAASLQFYNSNASTEASVTMRIKNVKLEYGNVATDWSPAPEDKADQSVIDNWAKDSIVAGETTINGGYIKTNTIETDQLAVDKIFATGSAVMNIINAQEINANRITSGLLSANRLDVYGLNVLNKDTNQQTFSVSNNGEVAMRGSVSSYDYHEGKTGWTINKDGTAEFNDIVARGSVITNDGGIVSSGGTGENLLANSSLEVNLDGWTNSSGYVITTMDGYKCTKVSGALTTTKTLSRSIYSKIKDNDVSTHYTMSCWIKLVNYKAGTTNPFCALYLGGAYDKDGTSTFLGATNLNGTTNGLTSYNNKDWQYMTCTFKFAQKPTYMSFCVYARDFTGDLYVRDIKLEEGDIATSWSAAKEDKTRQVRFWAGSTYEERESAPWIVYNDGSMKATQGEFSGVFSGTVDIGNIKIQDPSATAGGDAIVTIRNGQTGVNTVQLTDLKESKFAQNLVVANNTYSNMIELRQDGTGLFNEGINVAYKIILNDSGVGINGALISANAETKAFTMSNDLNIGTSNLGANLIVHGDASAENIRVSNVLYFGSVVKFTTTSNGINIDYIGG